MIPDAKAHIIHLCEFASASGSTIRTKTMARVAGGVEITRDGKRLFIPYSSIKMVELPEAKE